MSNGRTSGNGGTISAPVSGESPNKQSQALAPMSAELPAGRDSVGTRKSMASESRRARTAQSLTEDLRNSAGAPATIEAERRATTAASPLVVTRQGIELICKFELLEFGHCPDEQTRDSGWSAEEIVWPLVRQVGIR